MYAPDKELLDKAMEVAANLASFLQAGTKKSQAWT
jgi:hypothetical protein